MVGGSCCAPGVAGESRFWRVSPPSNQMAGKAGRVLKDSVTSVANITGSVLPSMGGAVDIVVVRQKDGSFRSSPFYGTWLPAPSTGVKPSASPLPLCPASRALLSPRRPQQWHQGVPCTYVVRLWRYAPVMGVLRRARPRGVQVSSNPRPEYTLMTIH